MMHKSIYSKDDITECLDLFEFDYESEANTNCTIDCNSDFVDGCFDKIINGKNANSLHINCYFNISASQYIYRGCQSSHIYCPSSDESECNVECNQIDACIDTEISVLNINDSSLNLSCIGTDSCLHTNIYGNYDNDIFINCIGTNSCFDVNVTANYGRNIIIWCEGNAIYSSYSSCNKLNVYATYITDKIQLICKGDYSCYDINIYANYSNQVIIDSLGSYAAYYGNIYAQNAKNMFISCKSQYSKYGCYYIKFCLPSKATTIECKGSECNYLSLYALNGYSDIINVSFNGCSECGSLTQCIRNWNMYCDASYSLRSLYYGLCSTTNCFCNTNFTNLVRNGWSNDITKQCDLYSPDIQCSNHTDCFIDCSVACNKIKIFGNNATSMTIKCGKSRNIWNLVKM